MLLALALACTAPEGPVTASLLPEHESVILVEWDQDQPAEVWVDWREADGEWKQTPAQEVGAGPVSLPILGAPYDAEVEYQPMVDGAPLESQWIRAGARPEALPVLELQRDDGTWDPTAPFLLTSFHEHYSDWSDTWWVVILDRQGRVVWAHRSFEASTGHTWVSRHVGLSVHQDALLVDRATAWTEFDHGAASTVVHLGLDGEVRSTWDTPGLHHAFDALPDGQIVWAARDLSDPTTERVMLSSQDQEPTALWECAPFLSEHSPEAESCGSNGLWWHATSDHLLLSLWSAETVIELDRASGQALRWFGHAEEAWAFEPEDAAFWWQHGPVYTDQGTLLLTTKDEPTGHQTLAREYALDEEGQTLEQVWVGGLSQEVYASYGGEAYRLPGGHTLVGYGAAGRLHELSAAGEPVWELALEGNRRVGRTTPLDDLYALWD